MKYVLAVALADELEGMQGNYNTVITGVGKINATLKLTEYLTNNPDTELVEIIEIPKHPWFVGVQFHPEYKSTVVNPHPLFVSFVKAVLDNKSK